VDGVRCKLLPGVGKHEYLALSHLNTPVEGKRLTPSWKNLYDPNTFVPSRDIRRSIGASITGDHNGHPVRWIIAGKQVLDAPADIRLLIVRRYQHGNSRQIF
jgi:hypothetical protein